MTDLQELAEIEALRKVMAKYSRFGDTQQTAVVSSWRICSRSAQLRPSWHHGNTRKCVQSRVHSPMLLALDRCGGVALSQCALARV